MTSMQIPRVNEDSVQFVDAGFRLICVFAKEFGEIDLKGELVAVVDLNRMSDRAVN